MSKMILDDELRAKFDAAQSVTEVCDANGATHGFFVTPDQFKKMVLEYYRSLGKTPR